MNDIKETRHSSEKWKKAFSLIEANKGGSSRKRISSNTSLDKCLESFEADAANW